jgi:hypothetical protein
MPTTKKKPAAKALAATRRKTKPKTTSAALLIRPKRKANPAKKATHYYVALVPKFATMKAAELYARKFADHHEIDVKIIADGKHHA